MFTYNEVYEAYVECYSKKKKTPGAMEFLFSWRESIMSLTNEINQRLYYPKPNTVFIIQDPKIREVFAADFRDRIVHHLIIRELLPLFKNYFIPESFSCMPGRGTLYGVQTMAKYMNLCLDGWYVMKMDVSSFFMSIKKSYLARMLEDFIRSNYKDQRKLEDLVWLCNVLVLHDPTENCIRVGDLNLINKLPKEKSLFFLPQDKGLAIGNYTSQMFANFYMTPLDLFIKNILGIQLYGRYVDDFMMYGPKEILLDAAPKIREFALNELDLTISPEKFYIQPYEHGVKFIGSVIKPGRIYCGAKIQWALEKRIKSTYPGIDIDKDLSSINSYLGLMKHYSSFNIRKTILDNLPPSWDMYLSPNNDYTKLKKNKRVD